MLRATLCFCLVGFLMLSAHVTFTNLKCSYTNISFGAFKECRIRAVNRTHKYISVYAELRYKPLKDITGSIQLLRNDHGYKPFFVNITYNVCKFFQHKNVPFVNVFFDMIKENSNINHTCPYDHDIIVDKFYTGNLDDRFDKYIPLPNGDYALIIIFLTYGAEMCKVTVYLRKS